MLSIPRGYNGRVDYPDLDPGPIGWTRRNYLDVLIELCKSTTLGVTVVGIDGRSGSGKSTLAAGLAALDSHVAVVHLDELGAGQTDFEWVDLLVDQILRPLRHESLPIDAMSVADAGPQSISIPEGTEIVILEGVGACRSEMRRLLDSAVWVHTSPQAARRRQLVKGSAHAHLGTQGIVDEGAFLDRHRPWANADLLVQGELGQPALNGRYGNVVTAPGPGLEAMQQ